MPLSLKYIVYLSHTGKDVLNVRNDSTGSRPMENVLYSIGNQNGQVEGMPLCSNRRLKGSVLCTQAARMAISVRKGSGEVHVSSQSHQTNYLGELGRMNLRMWRVPISLPRVG